MLRRLASLLSIASPADAFGVMLMTSLLVLWATPLSMNGGGGNQDASTSPSRIAKTAANDPQDRSHQGHAGNRFEDDARAGHRPWPRPSMQDGESEPEPDEIAAKPDLPAPVYDPLMAEVDQYLWSVYERKPIKKDSTGEFTWKDIAAATRLGMPIETYVIGGMDPDFRELLYRAGLAMDAAGIHWTMLSAFRDDYRQSLASGFKARTDNSLHGGSVATGGYGHGCAIDIVDADGHSDIVWHWLDANSARLGLQRLLPRVDPAHVQPRGEWHELGLGLRDDRLGSGAVDGETVKVYGPPGAGPTAPSETDAACINLRHREDDPVQANAATSPRLAPLSFKAAARAHAQAETRLSARRPRQVIRLADYLPPHGAKASATLTGRSAKSPPHAKAGARPVAQSHESHHAQHAIARNAGTT